ncbi:MAG TPA: 16S rRNA (uracil(1498)-N(3))-methyltransferase [Marinagarivorans sp.]
MNLLLLHENDKNHNGHITLQDYRAEHIIKILQLPVGHRLTVGQINGDIGTAIIHAISDNTVTLRDISTTLAPPPQLDVELILALPRPRMLQRSLQTIATMGVKKLHLVHTMRVEKSFWQTPLLKPEAIREQLVLGLEQAKATQIPHIVLHTKWRNFIAEQLPLMADKQKIVAHPGDYPAAGTLPPKATVLAIGPEGGFTQHEVDELLSHAFKPVQLGGRILRVETAVPVLLAKLFN